MYKERTREITIGLSMVFLVSLVVLGIDGIKLNPGVSGFVSYEGENGYYDYVMHKEQVIVSGVEFKSVVGEEEIYYIFDNGKWYKDKSLRWVYMPDMGETIWSGLYRLKSYDAKIYYDGKLIDDITEFARGFE